MSSFECSRGGVSSYQCCPSARLQAGQRQATFDEQKATDDMLSPCRLLALCNDQLSTREKEKSTTSALLSLASCLAWETNFEIETWLRLAICIRCRANLYSARLNHFLNAANMATATRPDLQCESDGPKLTRLWREKNARSDMGCTHGAEQLEELHHLCDTSCLSADALCAILHSNASTRNYAGSFT